MVFVLASAGIAAVAVGRSLYRHVMNLDEPESCPVAEPVKARRRANSADEWLIPDLELPEGVMEKLYADDTLLLLSADGVLRQLAVWLPRRHSVAKWTMLFSTAVDGYSLQTLYRKSTDRGALLVMVRDVTGGLFGAYVAHTLQPPTSGSNALGEAAPTFYGHGETFLFEVLPMGHLPPLLDGGSPPPFSVCAYRWSHSDDLFVASTPDYLAIGGGGGRYGLRLDDDLQHGRSGRSSTFRNPPLGALSLRASGGRAAAGSDDALQATSAGLTAARAAATEKDSRFFEIASVEVWSVDDWAMRHHVDQVVVT
jgi:hypothetical protein